MSNPVGSGNNELKMDKLLNPNRIDLIKAHRSNVGKFDPKVAEAVGYLRFRKSLFNGEPKPKTCLKVKTEGLDKIGLKEMEEGVVYEGKILNVMSVDRARSYEFEYTDKVPLSIQILVQDEQGDLSRAFIYNFLWPLDKVWNKSKGFNDQQVQRNVGIGRKMKIVNPVLKMAKDGKLTIVVDDPTHLVLDESVIEGNNLCRFCLNPDAKKRCSKCKTAYYCARACQANDWTHNKHKLICFGMTKANENSPYALEHAERPLWTVYELEQLCIDDFCPSLSQIQLREDYGFVNCNDINEEGKLLGLYQGMIKVMSVDLVKLHEACINGTLEDFITSSFTQYPSTWKGAYYEWFVKRPDVVRNRFTNN